VSDETAPDPLIAQYDRYPYPPRKAEEERNRLILGSPSDLREIDHYLFGGALDPKAPFRALVAGGGTGDGTIMLAQQLADAGFADADVTYLDLSPSSRRICEARAAARGLSAIRFVTGAIEDLPQLAPGPYDYIDCCGVLHHLADPAEGLRQLSAALKPQGGLGLMLYAPYGRSGVYETQALLRSLGGDRDLPQRIALARRLLTQLPATNRLKNNRLLADHKQSDAALVDLLLNARDRAYDVPALLDVLGDAGLELITFVPPAAYDPCGYLSDPEVSKALRSLARAEAWAAAEALAGNMKTHSFYAAKAGASRQAAFGEAMIPLLTKHEGPAMARAVQKDLRLSVTFNGLTVTRPLPRLAPAILSRIDGKVSFGAIKADLLAANASLKAESVVRDLRALYEVLNGLNFMLLRNAPPTP